MTVTYRDELGYISVEIDPYGVQFLDGEAYFSANREEYRIKLENLVEIN